MASYFSRGRNQITSRPFDILVYNKTVDSKTVTEAYLKQLNMYRDACRRMPFLIQNSYITHQVHPIRAKLNLAHHLRKFMHVRNPAVLDGVTMDLNEWIYESVWNYNHHHNFYYMIVGNYADNVGYSYLDEKKYGKCSPFLKSFYSGAGKPVA
jgi:hypothetical protein